MRCFHARILFQKPEDSTGETRAGPESATAFRTASTSSRCVTAVKNPTITEFSTMRLPSSSAMRVAGTL